jgi:hypothetical protein
VREESWLRFLPAALSAFVLFASGCVHPLGPGYNFADRQTEIRVSGASPDRIRIRVIDELQNNGDRTLRSLEVRLPEGPAFGEQKLRVLVQDSEISPQPGSDTDARTMRASFDPPWQQNDKRKVTTEWDLVPESSTRGTIAASPDGFFIADETAFPLWQNPSGVFAHGGTLPDKELVTIITPQDFRVLAAGKPLKPAVDGNLVARRFLIDPKENFLPYIVAGRYQEKILRLPQGAVLFWTYLPIDDAAAQTAAERLSSSMKTLAEFFGPAIPGEPAVVRIAEGQGELPAEFGATGDIGAASFPEGALLDSRVFPQGVASEPILQLAEYELARTWFGWRVRPRPEAQILMGRGMGLFGQVIAAEGRGPEARRAMIASLVDRYDSARRSAPDRRLMEPPAGYSRAERISTGYRGALFFVALEDLCGHENLKAALREIIFARAQSDTGYEELRAALEDISGRDLAEMFRTWLDQPGIPDNFRVRYTKTSSARFGY